MQAITAKSRRDILLERYEAGQRAGVKLEKLANEIRQLEGLSPTGIVDPVHLRATGINNPSTPPLCQRYAELEALMLEGVTARRRLLEMPVGWIDDAIHQLRMKARSVQAIRVDLERKRDRLWAALQAEPDDTNKATIRDQLAKVQAELHDCEAKANEISEEMSGLLHRKLESDPQPPLS